MENNYQIKHKFKRILCILFLILILISLAYITKYSLDIYNTKKDNTLLLQSNKEQESNNTRTNNSNQLIVELETSDEKTKKTERMLKIDDLQNINSDIIGWIEIENTDINYPVLQGVDNSYYMNHNYKKQYSTNGSVFLDKDYKWNPPSSNLLIYGHNMKNNTIFQSLLNYKNKNYYEQHPVIRFTTNSEDNNYEIIAAFESKVYYKSEQNVFRYYYFVNAKDENDFNNFINNSKKASLYDTGKTATYGEQLLTLSTCSYHVKDGRFAIVAKKQSPIQS